ncbi:hypothetical protein ACFV4K_13855 [Nocardia sp. NPDC059764]|uniref:hypothetical protein n=1 Tax=Nocardia sp. NPDC059764 TaxID=3346939 RepID=UPI003647CD25
MQGTPRDGALELMTGVTGPAGPAGEAARPFRWEGDIADQAALTALATRLTVAHAGKAWRIRATGALVYWNGTGFDSFTEAFGAPGPDGNTCTVTIGTVETGPVGSELQVTVTGTAPNLTLNLTVPRGIKGRKGEPGGPGPISQAPDYADGPHPDRAVPIWDAAAGKWKPRAYPGFRGPWSVVEDKAWDGGSAFAPSESNISAAFKTIAQLRVPAQDTAWRPMATGGVMIRTVENWNEYTTRVDAEVRIGSESGPIVGLGAGFPSGTYTRVRIQPFYGARGVTPAGNVGVVAAGQPVTLFVVLRRNAGNSNYDYARGSSYLLCQARPVEAS